MSGFYDDLVPVCQTCGDLGWVPTRFVPGEPVDAAPCPHCPPDAPLEADQ